MCRDRYCRLFNNKKRCGRKGEWIGHAVGRRTSPAREGNAVRARVILATLDALMADRTHVGQKGKVALHKSK